MDDTNQSDKNQKMVLKSIAKWLVIFALIAFVCYKNQDLMQEALEEIQITPVWKLVVCLLLGNLYFIAEGCIISEMTNTCDHRLSVWQGITCAYLCTFFRIATLGSGTGVAQLYYYNLNGIRVSTATGMSLAQYTFQKITIGLFGVVSFLLLILSGHSGIRKYANLCDCEGFPKFLLFQYTPKPKEFCGHLLCYFTWTNCCQYSP